jgi:hypothetical protein
MISAVVCRDQDAVVFTVRAVLACDTLPAASSAVTVTL